MRIQHNVMAMNAYRNYSNNTSALAKNLERLSSGYKINRAGDDAAGLAISEKMRAQITGLEAAQKNVKDGTSLVNTAEGAMQEIQDMLNRMVYLATQSSNGTYDNEVDRKNLQQEVDQLKEEINRIADSANFNGIKLLDGSLEENQAVTSIDISKVISYSSAGQVGKYETSNPAFPIKSFKTDAAGTAVRPNGMLEGDTYEYTVTLSDNTSYTAKLTLTKDADEGKYYLVADDGAKYETSTPTTGTKAGQFKADTASAADAMGTELNNAILSELKKSGLGDSYKITAGAAAGTLAFEAKKIGTDTPAVSTADCALVLSSGERYGTGNAGTSKNIGVNVTQQALNAGYEIKADDITEYDGTNYDDAVFEINGHKFVVLTNTMDTTKTGKDNDEYLRAVAGLGSDVTILVGGVGGLKKSATDPAPGAVTDGADTANNNFEQNIKKIAEVTGLTVTDAINETTPTGVAPGDGIRLSLNSAKSQKGGLTLQIGDTSDDYNQLRVTIKDMHTKSLGIDDIDISRPEGAQAAINTIKDAINTVSSVRGKLGAISNRLDHTANNLSVMRENITDAESAIRDTDIAEEMMSYTKNNILVQSAQAMLAQANQVPQGVLQLLQ